MNDDLSRLLAGELSPDQEAELLARIARDPQLQAEWNAMQELPGLLAALPDDAPPPELDAEILREDPPRISFARYAPWALAAAFLLFAVWPSGTPEQITMLSGQQLVEGPAVVHLANDVTVEVDGSAHIFVEPSPELVRVTGAKEKNMTPKTLLAAAAGAAITITVYEGSALISSSDAAPVEVEAGETHRIAGETTPPVTESLPTRTENITLPQALERIDQLEAELARAEFEGSLAEGRIIQHEGIPQAWPDQVPPLLEPDTFADAIRGEVLKIPGAELVEVDCDEFPCLATVTVPAVGDNSDWGAQLQPIEDVFEMDDDDWGTWINASTFRVNEDQHNYWTLAVLPQCEDGYDTAERIKYRIDQKVEGISAELHAEASE